MFPGLVRSNTLLINLFSGTFIFAGVLLFFPLMMAHPAIAAALAIVLLAAVPLALKCLAQVFQKRSEHCRQVATASTGEQPSVSIHLTIDGESPASVIRALKSLRHLDYPRALIEVLVIGHDLSDSATWKPVRDWCAKRPETFRLLHCEKSEVARADALNLALRHTRPEASLIVVAKADTEVSPDFLHRALAALRDETLTHVQLPIAFRGASLCHAAIEAEHQHYQDTCARAANRDRAILLTGNLSVIRRRALEQLGGWPPDTVTEGARLGCRLLERGGRGLLLDGVSGYRRPPTDFERFALQRHRLASGNARTFRLGLAGSSQGRGLPVGIQLSAWLSATWLLLPPGVIAAICFPASQAGPTLLGGFLTLVIAELAFLAIFARGPLAVRVRVAMIRLALLPEETSGLVRGFFFERSDPIRRHDQPNDTRTTGRTHWIGAVGFAAVAVALVFIDPLSSFALLVIPATLAARMWIVRELSSTGLTSPAQTGPDTSVIERYRTSAL